LRFAPAGFVRSTKKIMAAAVRTAQNHDRGSGSKSLTL
jgi:hypothetical protein